MKMHLVGQSADKPSVAVGGLKGRVEYSDCIKSTVNILTNIAETACEHAADLDLMRFVNYVDLYRTYLSQAASGDINDSLLKFVSEPGTTVSDAYLGSTHPVSFEQFTSDSRLLALAAAVATVESGDTVAVPAPLEVSANTTLGAN